MAKGQFYIRGQQLYRQGDTSAGLNGMDTIAMWLIDEYGAETGEACYAYPDGDGSPMAMAGMPDMIGFRKATTQDMVDLMRAQGRARMIREIIGADYSSMDYDQVKSIHDELKNNQI